MFHIGEGEGTAEEGIGAEITLPDREVVAAR